jgi:cyclase
MDSAFFRMETIAEGVHAAIGRLDTTAYSNAVIVDLGDRTLVVDSFMMPAPAFALRRTADELTGHAPSLLLLTHFHQDHWGGASAFPHALCAASSACRSTMLEEFEEYREWQQDPSDLVEGIESVKSQLNEDPGPEMREVLETRLRRNQSILEELPTLQFRAPEITIDAGLTLHGSKRSAVVRVIGNGHTDSDLYIELPDDGIVICGDLGFFETQPFMYYCDPEAWVEWLKRMEASEYEVFVPGHGPVGGKKNLALLRQYIETLTDLVRAAIARGADVEQALALQLPEPFAAWQAVEGGRFEANVRGLHARFTE